MDETFSKDPKKRMEADLIDLYFALQLGLDARASKLAKAERFF